MFPFFIKPQQQQLNKYVKHTASHIKDPRLKLNNMPGVSKLLDNTNHCYAMYLLSTKSWWGWIKSFIPGTINFKWRIDAAIAIDLSFETLEQVNRNMEIAKAPVKQVKKQVEEIKHYRSPINSTPQHTQVLKKDNRNCLLPSFRM